MSKPKPRVHELKEWPMFFREREAGRQPWTFRMNDRRFAVGDFVVVREYDPITKKVTGHRFCAGIAEIVPPRPGYEKPCALRLVEVPDGWGP